MTSNMHAIRRFFATTLAVFAALYVVAYCHGCTPPLTPTEQRAIAADGVLIGVCQFKGRECHRMGGADCFGVYDDCILDAGLREVSAR